MKRVCTLHIEGTIRLVDDIINDTFQSNENLDEGQKNAINF